MVRAAAPPSRTYFSDSRILRLPVEANAPQARLRATLCPGVTYSVVTFDQSHSSSSAMSWARPVSEPWPISERAVRITTVSSGLITTQTPISGEPSAARTTLGPAPKSRPSAMPPPTAAVPTKKERRFIFGTKFMCAPPLRFCRSGVDRRAYLLEGAAPANVGDLLVDIGVGRLRLELEQLGDGHDHAALAITALRHVVVDPGLLHLVQHTVLGEALDRRDLGVDRSAHRERAGPCRHAIHVHGAGAALRDAAAVLGAGEADVLPDRPEQRRGGIDVDVVIFAIDVQANHSRTSPGRIFRPAHLKAGTQIAAARTVIGIPQINNRARPIFRARSSRVDALWAARRWAPGRQIVFSCVQLFDDA